MAASGGGLAPSPPKRPTIIRQSNDVGPPVPSRPAPPLPSGDRSVPAVPSRPTTKDEVPSRPQPPLPSRPAEPPPPSKDSVEPKSDPPPPSRPTHVGKTFPATVKPSKTVDRSDSSSVKKRPEITIVSARPMSEIGFRDAKPSVPAKNAEEGNLSVKSTAVVDGATTPHLTPAPVPRVSPRGDKQGNSDVTDAGGPLRGPPPPVPRSSQGKKKEEMSKVHKGEETGQEVLNRGPPPPVPRPTVIKPNVALSGTSHRQPPPVPGRPSASPHEPLNDFSSEHHPEQRSDYDSHHISPPKPHDAAPPVPRSPSTRNKLPTPLEPHNSSNLSQKETEEIQHHSPVERNPDISSNEKQDKVEDASELYAVINKPKRPTIIRPTRASGKPDSGQEITNETKLTDEIKPKISPTPRVSRNITGAVETSLKKTEDLKQNNSEENESNSVPEFLRKKLKSTVHIDGESAADGVGPTAGSGPAVPLKPRPLSSRGPPPATKPKPSVLPKPQVAAKPTPASKNVDINKQDQAVTKEAETEKKENENQVISPGNVKSEKDSSENNEITQIKPAVVKRPTIIRPGRSVKSESVENVCQESTKDITKSNELLKPFSDDSAIETRSRPQPPLPSKRPVSMINIHKATEDEDKGHLEILNATSSKSSENVSDTSRPKPSPRPAARSRPVSMMVPSVSRPPLPGAGLNLDKSSAPLRPQGRPPVRPAALDAEHHELKHGTAKKISVSDDEGSSHIPFGVSVLPRLEKEPLAPSKPARKPPPPKVSPRKVSDSSDEEFVTAKDKPDRPQAGPARKSSQPARRDTGGDDIMKPTRPGAPPSPHKSSMTSSPDKDENSEEVVRRKPSRPEDRPQRPMSMPAKQILPSKPQRPKSQALKSGKKGVPPLPSRPKPGHPLYFHMMQVPHGIALHDYVGQHNDELSFKTGDLIILEKRIDADWILGKKDENEGMFPQDFVKVKMPLPGEKVENDDSSTDSNEMFYDASAEKPDNIGHGPRCRARFDFEGEGPDDLVFEEGDVIRLIERVGLEWRKGEINGRIGLFPLSFVEIIEDLPEEKEPDTGNVVKAIFDFEGEKGDLNFQAGESIRVTHMVNEEWLYGEIGGRKGQFPVQFVDHVPHELPPLSSGVPEAVEKHTESLAVWDNHDSHTEDLSSGVTLLGDTHSSRSQDTMGATLHDDTPYCIARYDYPAQTDEDLGFTEGDHIELVERISADWLKGKLGDKIGMFPSAFVDIKVDIGDTGHSQTTSKQEEVQEKYGVALYDFTGEAANELTFTVGDRFVVQDLVEGTEDWRWGVIDGHKGMFPAAFVQVDS